MAGGGIEQELRAVAPGRLDTYERLLQAVAAGRVWMLLWQGRPRTPGAQYGNMESGGFGYAPAVTSDAELAASGWSRAHDIVEGREIAGSLFRNRFGLWLNPHKPDGGVGIPWLDLRRVAIGLDRLPAGPLQITEPAVRAEEFYRLLGQYAHSTPVVRALRRCWVQPGLGAPYLAIGVDLYEGGQRAHDAVRQMMAQCIGNAPAGFAVATVAMADEFDPVAMWMARYGPPFYDRNAGGYGYPGPGQPGW